MYRSIEYLLHRFYTIDNVDVRPDPHKKYIADIEEDARREDDFEHRHEGGEGDKVAQIAFLLGVERLTQADIDQFMRNIKNVQPRKVEGFGFGKLNAHFHQD